MTHARHRAYQSYSESTIPRLASVPSHWAEKQLRCVADLRLSNVDKKSVEGQEPVRLCNYTDVYYNERISAGMSFMEATATHEQIRRFSLRQGDVLFTKDSETADDIGVPSVVTENLPGVLCGYHLAVARPSGGVYGPFLARALSASPVREQLFVAANGVTRFGLARADIGAAIIPIPPESEQRVIAAFLDREAARIDALIQKKQRLNRLLHERRIAVIAHAVSRGLNANAPLKESGISWIDQIPRHWEVNRVKMVARLESGHTPSKSVPEYWEDCDIPWVSLNDSKQLARSDYVSETAVRINKRGLDGSSARILPAGAVVFTRDATIGLAAITTRPMAVSQHLIAWIPGPRINSRFLLRVFNAMKPFLDSYTLGATIKTIGLADVKKLVTPVPPFAEQVEIAETLERTTRSIDMAIAKNQSAVDRLSEYRAALVSAVVTGQIDVREAA